MSNRNLNGRRLSDEELRNRQSEIIRKASDREETRKVVARVRGVSPRVSMADKLQGLLSEI